MTKAGPTAEQRRLRAAGDGRLRAAVTTVFALNGLLFASLFARMPALKADAGLSTGELGGALLAGSAALIASQLAGGALSSRVGSRPAVALGVVLYGVLLPLPSVVTGLVGFAVAFCVLATGAGLLDVSMNAQGALAERHHPRRIFASLHAAFSLGALGGALTGALAANAGVEPTAHLATIGVVAALIGLAVSRAMLPGSADAAPGGPLLARPSRPLAALAIIGLCVLLVEGSVGDWSAVLLAEERDASSGLAALGLAAFSLTMAVGRLAGDRIAERVGQAQVVRRGALVALLGAALAIAPVEPGLAIAGYAVVGAGLAGIFPLTLRAAAAIPGTPATLAIAGVSTVAYVGFLVGPGVIGLIAELTTLPLALALVLPAIAAVAILAPAARERDVRPELVEVIPEAGPEGHW